MSAEACIWAWSQAIDSAARKLVLVRLAWWADPTGVCWPGQMRLAAFCGIKERQVRTHLERLHDDGFFTKGRKVVRNGQAAVNVYQLHITDWSRADMALHPQLSNDRQKTAGATGRKLPPIKEDKEEKKTPQKKVTQRKNAANTIAKKWASVKDLPGYVAILRQLPIVEKAPVPVEWFEEVRAGAEEKAGGADLEVGLTDVAEKFRDWYSTPGQRNLKVWKTAWRRWVEESYAKAAEFSVSGQVHDPFDPNCPCQMCVKSRGESETTQSTEEVDGSEVEGGRQVETGRRVQAAAKQPGATAAEPAGEDQQGAREKAEGVPGVPAKVPG